MYITLGTQILLSILPFRYNSRFLCCIIIKGKYLSSRNRQIFVSAHELCRLKHEHHVGLHGD